jgi:sRNA-binding protein
MPPSSILHPASDAADAAEAAEKRTRQATPRGQKKASQQHAANNMQLTTCNTKPKGAERKAANNMRANNMRCNASHASASRTANLVVGSHVVGCLSHATPAEPLTSASP